jgi:hypothetical protein
MLAFNGKDCCVHLLSSKSNQTADNIVIPQVLIHDLLFTLLLMPTSSSSSPVQGDVTVEEHPLMPTSCSTETQSLPVAALTQDQLRVLWHQRLGHMHSRQVATAYKYATGVPKVPIASDLEACPVCKQSKLRKAAQGKESSRHATQCNQGLSIDFRFIVQDLQWSGESSSSSRCL